MIDFKKSVRQPKRHKFSWKRLILPIVGILTIFIIGAVLFIKFDTEAAAKFTDDVLRPFLGNDNIIKVEKIFFNSSDKINQLTSLFKKQKSPFIKDGSLFSSTN